MIKMTPIKLKNGIAVGLMVEYPKTTLLSISTEIGYIMCGVLNIDAIDTLHKDRNIIAARTINVRTLEDLLNARVIEATKQAENIGIIPEVTTGREALERMLSQQQIFAS